MTEILNADPEDSIFIHQTSPNGLRLCLRPGFNGYVFLCKEEAIELASILLSIVGDMNEPA